MASRASAAVVAFRRGDGRKRGECALLLVGCSGAGFGDGGFLCFGVVAEFLDALGFGFGGAFGGFEVDFLAGDLFGAKFRFAGAEDVGAFRSGGGGVFADGGRGGGANRGGRGEDV